MTSSINQSCDPIVCGHKQCDSSSRSTHIVLLLVRQLGAPLVLFWSCYAVVAVALRLSRIMTSSIKQTCDPIVYGHEQCDSSSRSTHIVLLLVQQPGAPLVLFWSCYAAVAVALRLSRTMASSINQPCNPIVYGHEQCDSSSRSTHIVLLRD
jgi:flagellar biosynthesis protein FliP